MREVLGVQVLLLLLAHSAFAVRHYRFGRYGRRAHPYQRLDGYTGPPIQITVYPTELSVRDGREASFDCRARLPDGSTIPVRWTRVGGPLPHTARDSGGSITINPVTLSDSGTYVCTAVYNGRSREAHAQLNVQSYGPQELQGSLPTSGICRADQRQCLNQECVNADYICDGDPDCRDRSDEQNCPTMRQCEPNEFKCRNNKCVQKMWLCDGDDDCGDRSDEDSCAPKPGPPGRCNATEFLCKGTGKCVPQSFHCDGTHDCGGNDLSDEMGCVQPTIVQPPDTNVQAPVGGTFQLTCRAVAVPEAYINWRLNWGPVCEPPRCVQHSAGGLGTLTVTNAQPLDQGAYTCEAINVKGRVLATPDCIVRIVNLPVPSPTPDYPRLTCKIGAKTPGPTTGRCYCKDLVTGVECDQCTPGSYNLNEKSPQGCLKCFCFGVTQDCRSSTWFRTKDKLTFAGDAQGVTLSDIDERYVDTDARFEFYNPGMLTHVGSHYGTRYWKLPQRFLGNKVTAYGGEMAFELQYQCTGRLNNEPLVVIKGNRLTLVHRPRDADRIFTPGRNFRYSFETYENNYQHLDGRPAAREDLMMALADLDAFLIRATHCEGQQSTSIGDVSWEIAVDRDTQERRALEVEQCVCPPGYSGLSCEDCAPGYERSGHGPYLGTCVPRREPPPPQCSPAGSVTTFQQGGRCVCKSYATGPLCDQCTPNSFYMAATNPQGCIPCFCSGVINQCTSSSYSRTTVDLDYTRGARDQLEITTIDINAPFRPRTAATVTGTEITFSSFYESPGQTLYWKLPQQFLGDKVTSYGGTLRYVFRYSGSGSLNPDPDVVIHGNGIMLQFKNREPTYPDRENTVEVKILEDQWMRSDGQPATREHLMMALADLDHLLIKMSYLDECSSSSLLSVSLEYAVPQQTGGRIAYEVEQCACPPGYVGTSCEDCAPGYSRTGSGLYLGLCEKCECHGHASECDKEHGFCINCLHNTEGDRCERCKPGFTGDARRGTPTDCQPERPARPCECNNHSPRGCDSFGRCHLCEHNTEGYHCEKCKKGFYGDATRGTPHDCQPCPCPGAADCFLDAFGKVQCRNCPPGLYGRMCEECAPGYTRTTVPGDTRTCVPIGTSSGINRGFCCPANNVLRVEIDPPKNLAVPEGSTASWYCRVIGHPGPALRLEWSKVGANALPPNAKTKGGLLTIENVRREDAGQYRCSAIGPHQYRTDDAHLTVGEPRRHKLIVTPPKQTVDENGFVEFSCYAPDISGCDLFWHKDHIGGPLPHGVVTDGGVLKIPYADLHHAGTYICTASLPNFDPGQGVLDVRRPIADVRVEPSELTRNEGETARFRCWVPRYDDAVLTWYRKGGAALSAGAEVKNGILNFAHVQISDAGNYYCMASDPSGKMPPRQSHHVRLNVGRPPVVVIVDPPHQSVPEGSPAVFRCRVEGQTDARLQWRRRDGRPFGPEVSDYQGILTIRRVQASDAGEYICTAYCPGGPVDGPPASLEVPSKPIVNPPDLRVNEDEPATFTCQVPGSPDSRLKWSRQGDEPLPYGVVDDGKGRLYFPHAQRSDSGSYICSTVDPRHGTPISNSDPARLHVGRQQPSPGRMPEIHPPYQKVNEGAPSRITCTVHGNPYARLTWRKYHGSLPRGFTQSRGELYIPRTTIEDAGAYICSYEVPEDGNIIDSAPATIEVVRPPALVRPVIDPEDQTVNPNDRSRMRCYVPGYPNAIITWSKESGPLPRTARVSNGELTIDRTSSEDSGNYVCNAKLYPSDPGVDVIARVNVRRPRTPQVLPKTQDVNENDAATIRCWMPDGDNYDVILKWRKRGGELPRGSEDKDGILTIPRTALSDAGQYICSAQDRFDDTPPIDSEPAIINVRTKDAPVVDPPTQSVPENSPAQIRCWMPGNPRAVLSWRKEDGMLPAESEQRRGVLQIRRTTLQDAGNYICTARDPDYPDEPGVDSPPAKIDIEPRALPAPEVDPPEQEVTEDRQSQISCTVPGHPNALLKWEKQNGDLPADSRVINGVLYIPRTSLQDAGNYICSAEDPENPKQPPVLSRPAKINVVSPHPPAPGRPEVDPHMQSVRENAQSQIRCWVPGNPQAKLEWRKRDGRLPHSAEVKRGALIISRTAMEDAGYYICTARDPTDRYAPGVDSVPARIDVQPAYEPEVDPPDQVVDSGDPSKITCSVESGDVSLLLSWKRKDGHPVHGITEHDSTRTVQKSQLIINRTTSEEEGEYICTVTDANFGNPVDSKPARINIRRGGPEKLQVEPLHQTVLVNEPSEIFCWAPDDPDADLRWERKDGILNEDAEYDTANFSLAKTLSTDAGEYICIMDEPTYKVSRPARIDVVSSAAPRVDPPEQTVEENAPSRVRCWVPGDSNAQLTWRKRDGSLPRDAQQAGGELFIPRTQPHDAGDYICTAQDPRGGPSIDSQPAKINVRSETPGPIINPPKQEVEEGTPIQFQCYVPGERAPDLRFGFKRPGGSLPSGATEDRGMLTIRESKMAHAGEYICTYNSPEGPKHSKPAVLNVKKRGKPPHPVVHPEESSVANGEEAEFICNVPDTEDEILGYSWGYQTADGPLPEGVRVEEEEDNNKDSMLVIESADEHHAGQYFCTARNRFGEGTSKPATLAVSDAAKPPTAHVEPRVWNGQPGDRHQFRCITTGTPAPRITWTGPHGDLPSDVLAIDEGKILDFAEGRMELNGQYTCTAENEQGTASDFGLVNIGSGIEIRTTPPGPKITVVAGEPLEVRCDAVVPHGDPEPTVEWLHDPGPERGDLPDDFKPVTISEQYIRHPHIGLLNAGKYTCRGTGKHAQADKDIYIEVLEPSRVATVAILGGSKQWFRPNEEARLVCAVTGSSVVDRLEWIKVDGALPRDADDHNEPGVLHFADFQPEYEGEYECRGYRNNEVIATQKVNVYPVNGGPLSASRVEIDGPPVQVVHQGNSLILTCTVNDTDLDKNDRLIWMRAANGLHSAPTILGYDKHLRLYNITKSYEGYYWVTIAYNNGRVATFSQPKKIEVFEQRRRIRSHRHRHYRHRYRRRFLYKRSLTAEGAVQEFDEKADATLECPVYAAPGAEFTWEREDGEMPEDATSSKNRLIIPSFDSTKEGTYRCKVKVEDHDIEGFVKAQILVPSTIVQVMIDVAPEPPVIGGRTYFDCKVTGDEHAVITWSKDGEDDLPDNSQVVGKRLQFVDLRESNTGTYKCFVKTTGGTALEARTVMNLSNPKRKRKHLSHHQKTARRRRVTSANSFKSHQYRNWFNF